MAQVQKFLFDTSFDDSAGRNRRTDQRPDQSSAFEDGRRQGLAEAAAGTEQAVAEALGAIAQGIGELLTAREAIRETMLAEAARLALAVTRKALPELARRNALVEVEGLIGETLGCLAGEPRVVIRIPDPLLDPLRANIDPIAERSGFEGDVVLVADPTLGPSDCRVEWADGGAERHSGRLWDAIDEAANRLVNHLGAPPPPRERDADDATAGDLSVDPEPAQQR